jgi:hypothetical protein
VKLAGSSKGEPIDIDKDDAVLSEAEEANDGDEEEAEEAEEATPPPSPGVVARSNIKPKPPAAETNTVLNTSLRYNYDLYS